jgi:hypothetical protein
MKRHRLAGIVPYTDHIRPRNERERKGMRIHASPNPNIEMIKAHVSHVNPNETGP